MNVYTRGVRNAFRNGIRAFSIVLILGLSIGLALSMLMARQAVDGKITSVKSSIGNSISVSPAGMRGFEGGGEPLTAEDVAKITATAHVSEVASTLGDRLDSTSTNLQSSIDAGSLGRRFSEKNGTSFQQQTPPEGMGGSSGAMTRSFTPPITVTGTSNPTSIESIGAVVLSSGEQIDGASDENVALVGEALATKNGLGVGSAFTAYGQAMTVKGVIKSSDNRFAGNVVVMPIKTLQRLSLQVGSVTSAVVQVDSVENVDTTVAALKATLGDNADVVSRESTAQQALEPLESIRSLSLFAFVAAVAAGAVIILLSMVMIVRERRREIGVFKALGASTTKVATQFMAEAATFTVLATAIGLVISILAVQPITSTLVSNAQSSATGGLPMGGGMRGGGFGRAMGSAVNLRDISAGMDWMIVVYGVVAAMVIAMVGSGIATWFIAKVRPAEAVRAE